MEQYTYSSERIQRAAEVFRSSLNKVYEDDTRVYRRTDKPCSCHPEIR